MRVVFAILLFLPCLAFSQKKAMLIDRNLQYPVTITDSVTLDQVTKGYMPIFLKDVDSMLAIIDHLKKYIDTGRPNENKVEDLKFGNSHFFSATELQGAANKYHIVVGTKIDKINTSMTLVPGELNKRALQRLSIFADYIRNNRALFKAD